MPRRNRRRDDVCPHCGHVDGRYIPDSPGLSRPKHMDDEEWAEYRFSDEARVELTHVPDYEDYRYEPGYDPGPGYEDAHLEAQYEDRYAIEED